MDLGAWHVSFTYLTCFFLFSTVCHILQMSNITLYLPFTFLTHDWSIFTMQYFFCTVLCSILLHAWHCLARSPGDIWPKTQWEEHFCRHATDRSWQRAVGQWLQLIWRVLVTILFCNSWQAGLTEALEVDHGIVVFDLVLLLVLLPFLVFLQNFVLKVSLEPFIKAQGKSASFLCN